MDDESNSPPLLLLLRPSEQDDTGLPTPEGNTLEKEPSQPSSELSVLLNSLKERKTGDLSRVKLYIAENDTGKWRGCAVGAVTIEERNSKFYLVLKAAPQEGTSEIVILDSPVNENTNYVIQNSSVITWLERDQAKGLSFVSSEGCQAIWSALNVLVPDRISTETDGDEGTGAATTGEEGTGAGAESDDNNSASGTTTTASSSYEYSSSRDDGGIGDGLSSVVADGFVTSGGRGGGGDSDSSAGGGSGGGGGLCEPPTCLDDVTDLIPHLRCLTRTASPTQKAQHRYLDQMRCLLRDMSGESFLEALWRLLDQAVAERNEAGCAEIAVLLHQFIVMYVATSNPFSGLAAVYGPGGAGVRSMAQRRYLDPEDPLVRMLSSDHYLKFFCAMEYEPELRRHCCNINHVAYLREVSAYRPVLCQSDESFKTTCQFIYRLLYLRDVCFPRHLDDFAIQGRVMHMFAAFYNSLLRPSKPLKSEPIFLFLKYFFSLRAIPHNFEAARFLLHLLTAVRSNIIAAPEKSQVYASLKSENVLESLEGYITGDCPAARSWALVEAELRLKQQRAERELRESIESDVELRHRPQVLAHERMSVPQLPEVAIEIFYQTVEHCPALLRQSLLTAVDSRGCPVLWNALCSLFRTSGSHALLIQVAEVLRKVLDSATLDDPEKDDLLSLFYDHGVIDKLINIVLTAPPLTFENLLTADASTQGSMYYIDKDLILVEQEKRKAANNAAVNRLSENHESLNGSSEDTPMAPNYPAKGTPTREQEGGGSPLLFEKSTDKSLARRLLVPDRKRFGSEDEEDEVEETSLPPAKRRRSSSGSSADETYKVLGKEDSSSSSSDGDQPSIIINRLAEVQAVSPAITAVTPRHSYRSKARRRRREDFPSEEVNSATSDDDDNDDEEEETFQGSTATGSASTACIAESSRGHSFQLHDLNLSEEKKRELLFVAQSQLSFAKCQVCEVLSFCVLKHSARIMYRNLEKNLHFRLIEIAAANDDPFFALYAVKYLKSCIVAQSDHYSRLFARDDVFYYVFKLLQRCITGPVSRGDGSVLESCILELFYGISKAAAAIPSMGQLLRHIVESYADVVSEFDKFYTANCNCRLFSQLTQQQRFLWKPNSSSSSSRSSSLGRGGGGGGSGGGGSSTVVSAPGPLSTSSRWQGNRGGREPSEAWLEESYFEDEDESERRKEEPAKTLCEEERFKAFLSSTVMNSSSLEDDEEDLEGVPEFLRGSGADEKKEPP